MIPRQEMKAIVELTNENIEMIHRSGFGVHKIENIRLIYRLLDLYCIGWISDGVFYGDKDIFDANNNIIDNEFDSYFRVKTRSVGFSFNYSKLPMEKITTQWSVVVKLLKSRKTCDVKLAVASIAILTSESWRFHAINNAKRNRYNLKLDESVWNYVDGITKELESFDYTLRDLINDWSKLSQRKPIFIGGKKMPMSETDLRKLLRMATVKNSLATQLAMRSKDAEIQTKCLTFMPYRA